MHAGRLWAALAITATLAGCSTAEAEAPSLSQDYAQISTVHHNHNMAPLPLMFGTIAPEAEPSYVRKAGFNDARPPGHCSLRDRFDRKEAIAYNFSDGQSRVGLRLGIDGIGLSNPADIRLEEVKVNFRYRFQPIKKKREHCLYDSPWQGTAASAYNELFVRENHTIYEEIDAKYDEIHDRVQKLFGD